MDCYSLNVYSDKAGLCVDMFIVFVQILDKMTLYFSTFRNYPSILQKKKLFVVSTSNIITWPIKLDSTIMFLPPSFISLMNWIGGQRLSCSTFLVLEQCGSYRFHD
ncbi:hypothetical protein CLU79DRAFT_750570 [Phycomyces nitens]|nr:hypothetical protein CLU79DRAFT_750570 [Phycomyces nitens]